MKRILKFSLSVLSLSVLSVFYLSATSAFAQEKIAAQSKEQPIVAVNGIAIVVNDEVITWKELHERMQLVEQRLKAQGIVLPPPDELRKQVIERLIVDRAQLQLGRDMGLRVDDVMLDRAMERMAEQNKMTLPIFRDQVEKQGMSYAQFRESVREDIVLQHVMDREVESKVQISEAEIDNYLLSHHDDKTNAQMGELSPEQKRLLARQVIHARKMEEATAEWMQELRDRAYVEIRTDDHYQ